MQAIMTALKLTVNEQKTRIAECPRRAFDFLGYTIGRCYSPGRVGPSSAHGLPASESRAICAEIGAMTRQSLLSESCRAAVVGEINRKLARLGQLLLPWRGEPSVPGGGQSRPASAAPVVERQTPESGRSPHSLSGDLPARRVGICSGLSAGRANLPWANSMNYLERKPDAGKPHVRFDERGVETESMASYSGTSNRKGWSPLRPRLTLHRATPRLYKPAHATLTPFGLRQFSALAVSPGLPVAPRLCGEMGPPHPIAPAPGSLRSSEN